MTKLGTVLGFHWVGRFKMMPVCIAAKERVQRNPSAQRGAVCLRRRAVRLLTPLHGHCAHIAKGGRAGAEVPPPEGGGR